MELCLRTGLVPLRLVGQGRQRAKGQGLDVVSRPKPVWVFDADSENLGDIGTPKCTNAGWRRVLLAREYSDLDSSIASSERDMRI